ncbi:PIN domain-containing protein [Nibrella viscosa]|uniref:Ribonuclease VapC n=1 Tax=Nibrella viscosa TaxID=1084524 RepID=A0ABP8KQX1_9BACT
MEDRGVLVDTSIFIQHIRAKNKSGTVLASLNASRLVLSSITVFELLIGAKDSQRKLEIWNLLGGLDIQYVDVSVAEKAADIFVSLKAKNQLIEFRDIFIAATALVHRLPVVTLNVNHFERIDGLLIL